MTRVKICGIRTVEDAMLAIAAGTDAIGLLFAPSPRQLTLEKAIEICKIVPPFVAKVGVFVNETIENVKLIAEKCRLDSLQLHGEESPEYCKAFQQTVIKAITIQDRKDLKMAENYKNVDALLMDGFSPDCRGGTGVTCNWDLAAEVACKYRLILAGGLKAENIVEAIRKVKPYAVDVSSGVETQGSKDPEKMTQFMYHVRRNEYGN